MTRTYDVIVLGVGGMGSAACFELARRGCRVLGLEQYPLGHDRGSSHGHTRIIRTAYYEHPDYVPLLRRAWSGWYDLEQFTGRHLLTECPCLSIGPAGSELVEGVRAAAREHKLAVEELTPHRINQRHPGFRVPSGYVGVSERAAGFLYVEECVRAHVDRAVALGAEVHAEEPVRSWEVVGDAVKVTTDRATYHAARLVVTAGAWATKLLADLGVPLAVMRQVLLWFDVGARLHVYRRDRFPIFLADVPEGPFYGLPAIDKYGLKVARHYGAPELPNPDGMTWETTDADAEAARAFVQTYLGAGYGRVTKAQACIYTLTPDRHFVLDRHPLYPQVAVACGFSGHGFKFCPAVGAVLADLAEAGRTELPIGRFRAGRFRS